MPNVGSRASARKALEIYKADRDRMPAGWKILSAGGTRVVYLNKKENVVYKIDPDWMKKYYDYNNSRELRNAYAMAAKVRQGKVGPNVRIPKTSGYKINDDVIVAMEFVKGRHVALPKDLAFQVYQLNFNDMHRHNYILDAAGNAWIIDMGSMRWQGESDHRVLTGGV